MDTELKDSKLAFRRKALDKLRAMTDSQRAAGSALARGLLERQPVWKAANAILFFAPLPEELDVWPLLTVALGSGKTVTLPRFVEETRSYSACQVRDLENDLRTGQFGIREPADGCAKLSLNRLDLMLVPGVAFDLHGGRLGRGKGFYDQLLAVVSGLRCGVAFDEQIVRQLPAGPHDVHMNCILTPTRWIKL